MQYTNFLAIAVNSIKIYVNAVVSSAPDLPIVGISGKTAFSLYFIIVFVCIVIMLIQSFFVDYSTAIRLNNLSTSKDTDYFLSEISSRLIKDNKVVIIDDIDRLLEYEDIYNELLNISRIYKDKDNDIACIINFDLNIITAKYNLYLKSKNADYKCEYSSIKNCEECNVVYNCDIYQLLKRNYEEFTIDLNNDLKSYIETLVNLDNDLFDEVKKANPQNFRDLKRVILKLYE